MRGMLPRDAFEALFRSRRPIERAFARALEAHAGDAPLRSGRLADALFLAGVHPGVRAQTLSAQQRRQLVSAWKRLASCASPLLSAAGEPCPHCGSALAQEPPAGPHCPRCQPAAPQPSATASSEPSGSDAALGRLRTGCALWNHAPWSGELYPPGLPARARLRAFAERFDCVEGNSFFYALPAEATLRRWCEETPASFRFYPKFPRSISHEAPLPARVDDARRFFDVLRPLAERLGTVFLQLPPYVDARRADEIRRFFEGVVDEARARSIALGCELRHDELIAGPSADALDAELRRLGVTRVLLDTRAIFGPGPDPQASAPRPKPELAMVPRRTSGAAVLRFVGHPEPERNEALLEEWSARLCDWLRDACDVTVFAHCPDERFSPSIARRLHAKIRERLPELPELPWDTIADAPQQGRLF